MGTFGGTSWGLLHCWQRGCDHPRAGGSQPSLCGAVPSTGVGSRSPVKPRDGGAGCSPGAAAGLGGTVQVGAAPASSTRVPRAAGWAVGDVPGTNIPRFQLLLNLCLVSSPHIAPIPARAAPALPLAAVPTRCSARGPSACCSRGQLLGAAPNAGTAHGGCPAPRQLLWQREWGGVVVWGFLL